MHIYLRGVLSEGRLTQWPVARSSHSTLFRVPRTPSTGHKALGHILWFIDQHISKLAQPSATGHCQQTLSKISPSLILLANPKQH